jgi:hypothetical protein
VPIVVAQDGRAARVLMLEVSRVEIGSGQQWLHPAFEHRRTDVNAGSGTFAEGMSLTWEAARITGCKPASSDIFWRLRSADGGPLPLMKLDGPSASASAYRAFWHIAKGLHIDSDVYVLADATASDGHLQAVGHLREKIIAINAARSSLSPYPPTLIAAKDVSADNLATLRTANSWAEVAQVGTLDELIAVRSVTVQAARDYLSYLADHSDKTPWYRNGKPVRFSEVHITPFVWKPKPGYSLLPDAASADGRTEERDWRPAGYNVSVADREAGPRLERTRIQERVPWHDTFRNNEAITVIAGGPGSGKTSILQWTARTMALRGLADLEKRTTDPDDVDWPIQTDLDAWASLAGQPVETLERAAIDSLALVETWGEHRLKALRQFMRRRLTQSKANTFFVLDALDQVAESRVLLLRERLQAIASHSRPEWPNEPDSKSTPCSLKLAQEIMSRGTKILISTRESGLRTHHQAMSFA